MPNCNSDIGKVLRSAMAASLKAWHHWDIITAIGVAVGDPIRLKGIYEALAGIGDDVPTDESVKIKEVYEAVRSAVYEKRTLRITKKRRAAGHAEFLARIMPDFYKENESYDFYEEVCFDPKEFILWLKNEKIVKISPVFQVFHDDDFGCVWLDEPFPNGAVTELDPKYFTDYHYYIRLPYWTLAEAACLLSKLSPDVMGAIEAEPYHMLPTETAARLDNKRRCEEIIKRACYLGTLDYILEGDEDGGAYCFRPLILLNWAKDAGIDIPDTLYCWADNDDEATDEETHGYANKNQITIDLDHPNLSKELGIAFQAWDAVYNSEGGFNDKICHIGNIKNWLKDNHLELPDATENRIARVVNCNKKGGATSIN